MTDSTLNKLKSHSFRTQVGVLHQKNPQEYYFGLDIQVTDITTTPQALSTSVTTKNSIKDSNNCGTASLCLLSSNCHYRHTIVI